MVFVQAKAKVKEANSDHGLKDSNSALSIASLTIL
jgi:hypothetical protein